MRIEEWIEREIEFNPRGMSLVGYNLNAMK